MARDDGLAHGRKGSTAGEVLDGSQFTGPGCSRFPRTGNCGTARTETLDVLVPALRAAPFACAAGFPTDRRRPTPRESITSSVTSSPRCAGRQCMKSASAARAPSARRSPGTARRSPGARPPRPPGPSTPRRRCRSASAPVDAVDRIVRDATPPPKRATRRDALDGSLPAARSLPATRHVTLHAEHRDGLRQRRRDVVAVADERDRAAAHVAQRSMQRQAIGQRLARMLLVGERVDDVEARRGGGEFAPGAPARRSGPRRAWTQRSRFRATSSIVSRPPSATSGGGSMTSPPSSRTAIWNVERVRSDGFSKSSATCLPSSGRSCGTTRAPRRLQLAA